MPSRNVIEVILQATDAASDVIDGGSKKIGSALDSIGGGLVKTGGALTALGAPFLGFAATAIKSAMDSEDAIAQLNATLKSTKGAAGVTEQAAIDLASSLQKVTTYGDEAILSGESLLLTFTNVGSGVFARATKAALDMSTAMKQDLKGSVVQLGKSLNDPINGLTALTRVGVTFTQAQKDQVKVLQESGDLMGAQGVILGELEKEFGGSAEAAGKTFGGALTILKNRFDDVMETIGNGLIPIVQQFTDKLGDLITWFENLDAPTRQTIVTVIAIGAALAIIGPILIGIGAALSSIGAIFAVVFSPVGIVIGLVIGALLLLAQHFNISIGALQVYGNLLVLYAQYYFSGVVSAIQTVIDKITDFVDKNPEFVVAMGVIGAAVLAPTLLSLAFSTAIGLVTKAAGLASTALGLLFSPVVILALAIGALVYAAATQYPGGLSKLLRDAATSARELAAILMGVLLHAVNTITDKVNNLVTAVSGISGIIQLLTTGQVTPGQVIGAVVNEINGGDSANQPSSNTGGGGFRGFGGDSPVAAPQASYGGVLPGFLPGSYGNNEQFHINGPVTVVANTPEDMAAKIKKKMRASG